MEIFGTARIHQLWARDIPVMGFLPRRKGIAMTLGIFPSNLLLSNLPNYLPAYQRTNHPTYLTTNLPTNLLTLSARRHHKYEV